MKNSKKTFESAGQSTNEVKKSHKHDANLQKNTTLYFQIGLILCLLGTYSLLEMQFQEKKLIPDRDEVTNVAQVEIPPFFEVEPDKPKKIEPVKDQGTYLANEVKEVENDVTVTETKVIAPDKPITISEPVEVSDVKPIERPVDIPDVGFIHVEKVPVYPGCERKKTNDEKRKCMSAKITKLVNKKFNTDIASDHGISGLQKIQTQFTVDKFGNVTDIKIRAPHPALEKEAQRVISKIPSMQPGKQRNTPVGVVYTLPIKFMARN